MLFKFLEKPIEITAFVETTFSFVNDYSPIKKSSSFIPTWWKNTPQMECGWDENNNFNSFKTTKGCVGIIGTYQNGYIIPMWSDLALKTNDDESWFYQFSDTLSEMSYHSNNQAPGFYSDHFMFKLHSPWLFSFSEDIQIAWLDPQYHFTEKKKYFTPYSICPTINKLFKFNYFFFKEKGADELIIPFGTPLSHFVPITERKIKFKTEVLEEEKYKKMFNNIGRQITFGPKGLNLLKILRRQKNG